MNRTFSVTDEKLDRHLELKREAEEDAARDRTYEEFKETYLEHILGNVDAGLRTKNRPDTADEDGGKVSRGQPKSKDKDGMSQNVMDDENNEGRTTSKKDYNSIGSRGKLNSGAESSLQQKSAQDKHKYDIPSTCKLEMSKFN